jgi:hypothetical protein
VALRICHPGPVALAEQLLAPMRRIAGIVLDTMRLMPYREIGSVTMDSPLQLPRIGYSESLCELAEPIISALPEVLTPGAPFLAMELRHTEAGAARTPPVGYEGLGYWNSPFLFVGMSVTLDASAERHPAELGKCLDKVFEPYRTGTNGFTFLLPQQTPVGGGDVERVRQAYRPSHYGRLASLKAQYDPDNLFGGDRNIPPAFERC